MNRFLCKNLRFDILLIPNLIVYSGLNYAIFVRLVQYGAKSIATCKKNPYIINQNHIFFSKKYCEVISG